VLNNSGYVKPETRALVAKALQQNDYQHSPRRRSVPHEISEIILVITGDITSSVYTSHIEGITREAEKTGKRVFIVNSDYSPEKEEDSLRFACRNNFAGVIMLNAIETPGLVQSLRSSPCPVVMVNRYLRSMDTDVVCIDNFRSGYMATEYLISHGHKRIAHLGGPKNSITCQERLRGYNDVMHVAGLPIPAGGIYYGDLQYESGLTFGRQICMMKKEDRFTAVYSANDIMASGLIDALFEGGFNVPNDVSVTCSDNTKNAVKSRVKLTTVDHDPVQMGISAVRLLMSRIENPNAKVEKIVYAPTLTKRSSVKSISL
jgi:DNA-binding LacI/PurR family transcriptional regulator